MNQINLAGEWLATWGDGLHSRMDHFLGEMKDPLRYLRVNFPGSIHTSLQKTGLMDDPRLGINSLSARWVEEHFWILRKTFDLPQEAMDQFPFLNIGVVDGVAKIALNGKIVGDHWNANRPLSIDLSGAVKAGKNELVILLESGLFKVADLPGKEYSFTDDTLLNKRHHLRQAQYQFGWDWNPRLIFIGLHGDILITWGTHPRLDQMLVTSKVSDDLTQAEVFLRPKFILPMDETYTITLTARAFSCCDDRIWEAVTECELNKNTPEGEIAIPITNPELWYPRGYGDPHQYQIEVSVHENGVLLGTWKGKYGLRKVELLEPPHPEGGRYFHIQINNQTVFWKGANWVPPEMSAHEVSEERVRRLVELAVDQNMNALRIWGGGVWAGHPLLDLCDEHGILVWHDMLFACARYPADRPEFYAEVEKEVSWGVREFSRHPSLIVWSGNNELEWGHWSWGYQNQGRVGVDYVLFHHLIPKVISGLEYAKIYWPSSPYSSPTEHPNDPTRGDQHPWNVSLGSDSVNFWAYRRYVDRFPNEGGVLGCAPLTSLKKFLSPGELNFRTFAWEHHDNTANFWGINPGITYQMVEYWLNLKPEDLTVEEYAIGSGLIQAEGLKEYIVNYRRRYPSTTSAIYWDFNDSWPTVSGWGTMDYYLNRKLSYHPVRRSFAPLTVVLADEGDEIGLYVVNQTDAERSLSLLAGDFVPKGERRDEPLLQCKVHAFCSERVGTMVRNENRIFYALLMDENRVTVAQDRLLLRPFHYWEVCQPKIQVSEYTDERGRWAKYESLEWVWSVVLDPSGEKPTADDVFDLIPGIPYLIPLAEGQLPMAVAFTGNHLLLR